MRLFGFSILILTLFTACAPENTGESMSLNSFITSTVLWFLAGLGIFWALVLKPQQVEQQKREAAVASFKNGVKVMLANGIYGKIVDVEKDEVSVEIAKGVNVKVHPDYVQPVITAQPAKDKK